MGNRVFGCDDCQIICPWNRYSSKTKEIDFRPRHNLDNSELVFLFQWSEEEFEEKTQGSPIRRIGYQRWLRNLSVGLGNAPPSAKIINALQNRAEDSILPNPSSSLVTLSYITFSYIIFSYITFSYIAFSYITFSHKLSAI